MRRRLRRMTADREDVGLSGRSKSEFLTALRAAAEIDASQAETLSDWQRGMAGETAKRFKALIAAVEETDPRQMEGDPAEMLTVVALWAEAVNASRVLVDSRPPEQITSDDVAAFHNARDLATALHSHVLREAALTLNPMGRRAANNIRRPRRQVADSPRERVLAAVDAFGHALASLSSARGKWARSLRRHQRSQIGQTSEQVKTSRRAVYLASEQEVSQAEEDAAAVSSSASVLLEIAARAQAHVSAGEPIPGAVMDEWAAAERRSDETANAAEETIRALMRREAE